MTVVTPALAVSLIESASRRLAEHQDELSRLDAIAGDGDHGVNMVAAFTDAEDRLAAVAPATAAEVFSLTSQAFLETVGGAAGALLGAFFGGAAQSFSDIAEPTASDFFAALQKGLDRLIRIGKTELGQKSMVDALQPAIGTAQAAIDSGAGFSEAAAIASTAAAAGAAATAAMQPAAGRARYAAEQSRGTPDPGATTIAHLFSAWAEVLTQEATT